MIRVIKPPAPTVLATRGRQATSALKRKYARSSGYRNGTRPFQFNGKIYAHPDVKAALLAAQHDKCAFCESKITHIGYGDVEHYRPKGGFKQRETDGLQQPGYYWLAYTWENLLVSCTLCNQEFKKNLFPLRTPTHRARSHRHDLSREKPLLLHPADDPAEKHITFRGEIPVARNRSRHGATTIRVLGLDRPKLNEARLTRRQMLLKLKAARDSLDRHAPKPLPPAVQKMIGELDQMLADAKLDTAEYAAMARTFL